MNPLKVATPDPKGANWQSSTIFDEFDRPYTSGALWTTVAGSSGSTVVQSTGGVDNILFTSAATNNDVQGIIQTLKTFNPTTLNASFAQGVGCETLVNISNQAGNTAGIYFGFANNGTFPGTGGAVPSASGSRALIFKAPGDSVFSIQTANGSTIFTQKTNFPAPNGQYLLRVNIVNRDPSNYQVTFTINTTAQLRDGAGQVIVATLPISGLADMGVVALTQAGSGNVQTQTHDYITATKARNLTYQQ